MGDGCDLIRNVAAQLGLSGHAERVELGQSNEVWLGGDWVLRIGGVDSDDSLPTEAQVVQQLPSAVGRVWRGSREGDRFSWQMP